MKAIQRRQQEELLRTWKMMWQKLCEIGPSSERFEDVQAHGNVGDYILDQIAAIETVLHNAKLPRHHSRRRLNSLPSEVNASDNRVASGDENA
jgi:hypothetical protein